MKRSVRELARRAFVTGVGISLVSFMSLAQSSLANAEVPHGAAALGYSKRVIDLVPAVTDISPDGKGNFAFYSGQWFGKTSPPMSLYSMSANGLAIKLGGGLVTISHDFKRATLPLLPGKDGFYVEFEMKIDGDDHDNWPTAFLMPAEHNGMKDDHYEGDPPGFERWMELDVDEGGFGPGHTGTVLSWSGMSKNYSRTLNRNHVSRERLDRQQWHTFGASFDPKTTTVTWWVDGVRKMSAGPPEVPAVAVKQNFYLLMGAQSHGEKRPYTLFIRSIRAYVPSSSPLAVR